MNLKPFLHKSVLIGLLSILASNCAVTKPKYTIPNPPVEKPICSEKIYPLQNVEETCLNVALPALECLYQREAASDAYVEVLINALKQVNK